MSDAQRLLTISSEDGSYIQTVSLPLNVVTPRNLTAIINDGLNKSNEDAFYRFYFNGKEFTNYLENVLEECDLKNEESALVVSFVEEAPFRVRPVNRCTGSLQGHAESVISASFDPSGTILATGSGDRKIKTWDLNTKTPLTELEGHTHWVLCLSWAPDGVKLASGDKSGVIFLWNPGRKEKLGRFMQAHRSWVTCISWEPYHVDESCSRLVSSSNDHDLIIWNARTMSKERVLASHTQKVSCVKWGGEGLIYSASSDRSIKVWRAADGALCRTLTGHAHWVNTLALNTDWPLRVGPYLPVPDSGGKSPMSVVKEFYNKCRGSEEFLVSGSDDNTLFLWKPGTSSKAVERMTGHQQPINDVKYSPDGRIIASASFDKSIRLWHGTTGKFMATLRGHVQAVFVLAWAADSRFVVSASADSTVKVWNVREKKLLNDLPGHSDAVYAVDWSADGRMVATGSKDKLVRIWEV